MTIRRVSQTKDKLLLLENDHSPECVTETSDKTHCLYKESFFEYDITIDIF